MENFLTIIISLSFFIFMISLVILKLPESKNRIAKILFYCIFFPLLILATFYAPKIIEKLQIILFQNANTKIIQYPDMYFLKMLIGMFSLLSFFTICEFKVFWIVKKKIYMNETQIKKVTNSRKRIICIFILLLSFSLYFCLNTYIRLGEYYEVNSFFSFSTEKNKWDDVLKVMVYFDY